MPRLATRRAPSVQNSPFVRVAYFVQTHRASSQVLRLLSTLRRGSPEGLLVVGHDPTAEALDPRALAALEIRPFRPAHPPRRGYWSMFEPFVEAVELLDRLGTSYDWLVYLSGQDYPVQPLETSERFLAESPYDGYLSWIDVDAETPEGRRRQGRVRYFYRYADHPKAAPALRLLRKTNGLQPWWHVHVVYGPRLGLRVRRPPFGPGVRPCWGSQWTTLRRACAERVAEAARTGSPLVEHFRQTVCPDEAFSQTVLVNDGRFRLSNDSLRYVDMWGSRNGRPRVLGWADGPALAAGGYAFARKFDVDVDAAILDWLDQRLAPGGTPHWGHGLRPHVRHGSDRDGPPGRPGSSGRPGGRFQNR